MSTTESSAVAVSRVPSKWTSHLFSADISEVKYNFRVLKMTQSVLIYIGHSENETFDEMAMALPTADTVSTTILGAQMGCDSQEMAQQFAKRLKKQVFVSCNVPSNNTIRPLVVKCVADEIKRSPEAFWNRISGK